MTAECSGKKPHDTRAEAITALDHMKRRPAYKGGLNVYECPECGKFHLGRREKVKVKEK